LDLHMPPSKRPTSKRSAGRLVNALAEAAWTEADGALAEALLECDRAREAESKKAREQALELLFLALARIGKQGAIEEFDPVRHELATSPKRAPKRVRIAMEGVARGRQVLIKARVTPARAKRS
jgi:hypothetical protein